MPTTLLPHSQYASGIGTSDSSNRKLVEREDLKTNEEKTAPRGPFLLDNGIISFYKHEAEPEEKSFVIGLFVDVYKNVAKILNGSMLTDIVKTLNKNANLTWQEAIYKSFMDSGPSRIINDIANSFMVRFFNGNHSFFGLFALPYVAPELSSQILSIPLVTIMRALTSGFNVNNKSAQKDQSDQEADIKDAIEEKNAFMLRFQRYMSSDIMDKIKPYMNKIFSLMGIEAGEDLTDKEGNFIARTDFDGKVEIDGKTEQPKSLKENEKIKGKLLGGLMAGTFLGSFLLPKHSAAFGFEKAKNIPRVVGSTIFTSLCRLNTTLIHNGVAMHLDSGKNFDSCFRLSVIEKMLVPFTQYASDALGSYLTKFTGINGAAMAMTLRLITEVPSTYLSNGIANIAESDRMSDSWVYLSHKFWKPVAMGIETITKPAYKWLSQNIYSPLGMFDKHIPNMYDVDIRTQKIREKDNIPQKVAAKYESNSVAGDLGLLVKKTLQMPRDLWRLKNKVIEHAKKYEQHVQDQLDKANENVDVRRATEEILNVSPDEEIKSYKPSTAEADFNRQLMHMLAENKVEEAKQSIAQKTKVPTIQVETSSKDLNEEKEYALAT